MKRKPAPRQYNILEQAMAELPSWRSLGNWRNLGKAIDMKKLESWRRENRQRMDRAFWQGFFSFRL